MAKSKGTKEQTRFNRNNRYHFIPNKLLLIRNDARILRTMSWLHEHDAHTHTHRDINITVSWLREHDEHAYLDINRTVSWLHEHIEHT
jgi:hypothetical protein